jgi:alpha-tubulin suppressor-like RCC1 family protein
MAWGSNADGQLGNGTTTDSYVPAPVTGLTGVTAIASAIYHSLALTRQGTVMAWGYNADGELGSGTTTNSDTPVLVTGLTGVTAIATDFYHSVALVGGWGWNPQNRATRARVTRRR